MSTQQAMPISPQMLSRAAVRPARRKISVSGLTFGGVVLFVTALLVVASGFASLRPHLAGLRVHPYLFPMTLALPFVLMSRLGEFPSRILGAMIGFVIIYVFSILSGGGIAVGEMVKIATALVTMVAIALLVRRRGDFVAGALGLSIAIAVLAVNGLSDPTAAEGVDAIEGANKNSYSLFALPAILMAGYICVQMPTVHVVVKSLFMVGTIAALSAIFMSMNRSGYLGAVLIGGMLFWDRKGKGLLLVGLVAMLVIFYITQFGSTAAFDARMEQTAEGVGSDDNRVAFFLTCWEIGLENPVMGVSPQELPFEIGRRCNVQTALNYADPHNVLGHLFAGSGVFSVIMLCVVSWTMWYWKPRNGIKIRRKDDPLYGARSLMRMMLVLWIVRGMFTREILYNPSFCIAVGLCIGLCMLADVEREGMDLSEPSPRRRVRHGALPQGV